MDGAVQHAPQAGRQFILRMLAPPSPQVIAHRGLGKEGWQQESFLLDGALAESATLRVMHLVIAVGVGFAPAGALVVPGAIKAQEPPVTTAAHHRVDRW